MNTYDAFTPPGPTGTPRAHGGRRRGAGRPPAYTEPLLRKTVTLPRSYVDQLTAFGLGNLSEGIRYLVEFAYDRDGQPWFCPATKAPARAALEEEAPLPRCPPAGEASTPTPPHNAAWSPSRVRVIRRHAAAWAAGRCRPRNLAHRPQRNLAQTHLPHPQPVASAA